MLLIPAEIEGVSTRKDKTIKLVIGTSELTPDKAGQIIGLQNAMVYLAIKKEQFNNSELEEIEKLKAVEYEGKTPSQRLRAVLYRYWEQDKKGFDSFSSFYDHYMEKHIDQIKSKLE